MTLETLRNHLCDSPAWHKLGNGDSELGRILLSNAFKDPEKNQQEDQIDSKYLLLYGMLHCMITQRS